MNEDKTFLDMIDIRTSYIPRTDKWRRLLTLNNDIQDNTKRYEKRKKLSRGVYKKLESLGLSDDVKKRAEYLLLKIKDMRFSKYQKDEMYISINELTNIITLMTCFSYNEYTYINIYINRRNVIGKTNNKFWYKYHWLLDILDKECHWFDGGLKKTIKENGKSCRESLRKSAQSVVKK